MSSKKLPADRTPARRRRGPRVRHFGSVEQRPPRPGFYLVFNWKGVRYRRFAGLTAKQADRKLSQIQARLLAGEDVHVVLATVGGGESLSTLTFERAVPQYLEYAKARKKASTLRGDRYRFAVLMRGRWAAQQLDAVSHRELERWVEARLKDGASGPTINRDLNLGSALYRWAIKLGYARDNPFRKVERFSERGREKEVYLTAAECAALLDACPAFLRNLVATAIRTGLRRGELLALRWRSVDLDRGEIVVEPATEKAGRGRVVPIGRVLREALLEMKRARTAIALDGSDPVFVTQSGSPLTEKIVRSSYERAVRRCEGIPLAKRSKVNFHTLRHTAASLMIGQGVPLHDVGKVLGHSTPAVTARYAHLAPEAQRAAVDKLDGALGGVTNPDAPRRAAE